MAKKKKGSLKVYLAEYTQNAIKTRAMVVAPGKKMAIKAIEAEAPMPFDVILERVKVKPHFVQILKQTAKDEA